MDTDNPTGPEPSIENRLAALDAPEAVAEPVETEVSQPETVEQPPEEAPVTEATEEPPAKEPGEPNDPVQLRALMTRKTQEAANLAEAAQDRIAYADARDQFSEVLSQKFAEISTLKQQYKALSEMDVSAYDQASLWRIGRQLDAIKEQISTGERQLQEGKAHLSKIADQHASQQWDLAVKGAIQRIGSYTPGEDAAMLKLVERLGFTQKELKGRFADARFLEMAFKAAKFDVLQANKGKSLEAVKGAPPVLKPGASNGGNAAADQKYRQQREALRKSGDFKDAARLFLMKG